MDFLFSFWWILIFGLFFSIFIDFQPNCRICCFGIRFLRILNVVVRIRFEKWSSLGLLSDNVISSFMCFNWYILAILLWFYILSCLYRYLLWLRSPRILCSTLTTLRGSLLNSLNGGAHHQALFQKFNCAILILTSGSTGTIFLWIGKFWPILIFGGF